MKYFPARVSKKFLVFTYIASILIIGATVSAAIFVVDQDLYSRIMISLLGFLIVFVTRAFVANGYEIADAELIIHRWVGSIRIPFFEIKELRSEDALAILKGRITIRLFADGGLWGAHGIFYNKNIGKFYMYMTDEKNTIDIVRKDGCHVFISPDPRDKFAEELKNLITL